MYYKCFTHDDLRDHVHFYRGFRGKLPVFHFIENPTVILKVDPTKLKDLRIVI